MALPKNFTKVLTPILGFSLALITPLFSQASRGELCSKDHLKDQVTSSQNILSFVEPGTAYSYGTGYKEAAIYGQDDRIEVDTKAYPFRTIGKLEITWDIVDKSGKAKEITGSSCTASLVGNCQLLTARHCVVDQAASTDKAADLALRGGKQKRLKFVFFVDALGRRFPVSNYLSGKSAKPTDDFAFLKINGSPGKELGYAAFMNRASGAHKVGSKFIVAGFNGDIKEGRVLTADMTAKKVAPTPDPRLLTLRADNFAGSSGGPTYAYASNGVPYIAGINIQAIGRYDSETGQLSQSYKSDDEKEKLATSLATEVFAKDLQKFIKSNPCDAGPIAP